MVRSRVWTAVALVATMALVGAGQVSATELTVGKAAGADHTTIQAALNAIQGTALGRDGVADLITILDSASYDEQLNVGKIPSVAQHPGNAAAWLATVDPGNLDPITIQGAPGQQPVVSATAPELVSYGVFPDNADDNFVANVAYLGTSITFRNIQFSYHEELALQGGYMFNGQARELVFEDCLFNYFAQFDGEDYINLNNSDILARDVGLDNSNTVFKNCVMDGTQDEVWRSTATFLYFHGFDSPGETQLTPGVFVDTCMVRNWDTGFRPRGRPADREFTTLEVLDSYFDGCGVAVRGEGNGQMFVQRSIFNGNLTLDDIGSSEGALSVGERSGWSPGAWIGYCLFYNNASEALGHVMGSQAAAVRVQARTNQNTGPVWIEHCTFDGNGIAVRFIDGTNAREGTIRNSIISNSDFAGIDALAYAGGAPALLDLAVENNIFFNNGETGTTDFDPDPAGLPSVVVTDKVNANPQYVAGTTRVDSNLQFSVSTFELAATSPAVDAAVDPSWASGDLDKDPIIGAASDIGAQERAGRKATVAKDGTGDYTTIQAALNAVQGTATGRDDLPDTITILDSAVYDEQLNVGQIPPSAQHPGNAAAWLAMTDPGNLDPITIQGAYRQRPQVIATSPELVTYGVFPDNADDSYVAGVAYLGTSITFQRMQFSYHEELAVQGGYMFNGQARDLIFDDVLFDYAAQFDGEDYINLNNSDILARQVGLDNSNTAFYNCVADGTQDQIWRSTAAFLYFHGFDSQGTPVLEPTVLVDGCRIVKWDTGFRVRGRPADREFSTLRARNSYFAENVRALRLEGNGYLRAAHSIFHRNMTEDDIASGDAVVMIGERSGWTPSADIYNSLFYKNASEDAGHFPEGTSAAIRIQSRTGQNTGPVDISGCTFDSNGRAIRFIDGTHPRQATISNSILSNTDFAGIVADEYAANPANLELDIDSVLLFNNTVSFQPDPAGFPNVSSTNIINANPLYVAKWAQVDYQQPWAVPVFELQETSPAIDAANDALASGFSDLDGTPRFSGPATDLGAQEFDKGPYTGGGELTPTEITSITGTAAAVTVQWMATGNSYQLQRRASMTAGDWENVGAPTAATTATDNAPPAGGAFYQVLVVD